MVLLVDGNSVSYRGWAGMPALMSDKYDTSVVYHMVMMLRKFVKRYDEVDTVIVAWDSRRSFRIEKKSEYKINRRQRRNEDEKKRIEKYYKQVSLLKQWLPKIGVNCVEEDGYEADDIIAVLVRRFKKMGKGVVVLSGDSDLVQLCGKGVRVVDVSGRERKSIIVGGEEIEAKYVVWAKAVVGDKSDGVGGVQGLGVKWFVKNCVERGMSRKGVFEDGSLIYDVVEKVKGEKGVRELQESYELVKLPFGLNFDICKNINFKRLRDVKKKDIVDFLYEFNIKSIKADKIWK